MSFSDHSVDVDRTVGALAHALAPGPVAAAAAESQTLPLCAGLESAGEASVSDCSSCARRKRHGPTGHQICDKCFHAATVRTTSSASASATTYGPVRSHKKQTASGPGQAPLAARLSLLGAIVHHIQTHHWVFGEVTRTGALLANMWLTVVKAFTDTKANLELWSGLFGGAQQLDLLLQPQHSSRDLQAQTISHARNLLAQQGIDKRGLLHVAAIKLLRMPKGVGPQRVHYDALNREQAAQRWSFLLYCGDAMSTFMPLLSHTALLGTFRSGKFLPPAQIATASKLLAPENFTNFETHAGSTMIFRTDVAHYGPKNETQHDRIAVYLLFSPTSYKENPLQDNEQRLPLGTKGGDEFTD